MQIGVPFAYEAEVRNGRRREKVILGEWTTVEVNEVASDDAPVLAVFEVTKGRGTISSEIREFDGHCYRPKIDAPHGREYDIFARRVDVGSLGQENPIVKTFFGYGWGDVLGRGNNAINPDSLATVLEAANSGTRGFDVVSSFRNAVLQRNHDVAETLIVIDGQVWERCLAPHLLLALSKRPPEVSLSFEEPGTDRALQDDIIVPISEMSSLVDAVQRFHAINERQELTNAQGRQYLEAAWNPEDVVYPTVTSFGPSPIQSEIPYLVGRAEHYLKAHFGHIIGDLQDRTAAFARSWADLKDAVELTKANPGADTAEHLVSSLDGYLERCAIEGPRIDTRDNKPFYGTERHKVRFDLRLACELSAWKAFMDRADDHKPANHQNAPRPR
ncbi:hypothetical protein [Rhizobium sp. BK176]|uniref:hypothetical protein n=1 Tax=Rhizobium sp. BK176 TaxID=2587071 RepID=UPI00216914AD|nr:hypothetical protein [Rhizobium sp. BK176]MCS4089131.1 hypothetical protein [Rhizobium sp. BK176]